MFTVHWQEGGSYDAMEFCLTKNFVYELSVLHNVNIY